MTEISIQPGSALQFFNNSITSSNLILNSYLTTFYPVASQNPLPSILLINGSINFSSNTIGNNPLFNPDFSLQPKSPAIDAGVTSNLSSVPFSVLQDIAKNNRVQGSTVDQGAFEAESISSDSCINVWGRVNAGIPGVTDGLVLWLDANDPSTRYQTNTKTILADTSGQQVRLWVDKSPLVNSLKTTEYNAFANTTGPVLQTSLPSLNGKGAMRFSPVNDQGLIIDSRFNVILHHYTMFVVDQYYGSIRRRSFHGITNNWLTSRNQGYVAHFVGIFATPNTYPANAAYIFPDNVPVITTCIGSLVPPFSEFIVNGSNMTTNYTGAVNPGNMGFNDHNGVLSGETSNVDVAEVLVYDRPLSIEERKTVEAYLAHKYSIIINHAASIPTTIPSHSVMEKPIFAINDTKLQETCSSGSWTGCIPQTDTTIGGVVTAASKPQVPISAIASPESCLYQPFPEVPSNLVIWANNVNLGAGTGTSSANAMNLTTALATATTNNEIWMLQTTYTSTPYAVPSGIRLYGGFVGTETMRNQRSTNSSLTIIDGNNTTRCFTISAASGTLVSVLDTLHVFRGTNASTGGGILANNANLLVRNCLFTQNNAFTAPATGSGGAISATGTSATIYPTIVICGCTFGVQGSVLNRNFAQIQGGAVAIFNGILRISNSRFFNNDALIGGTTQANAAGGAVFINNTLGVFNDQFNSVIVNSIFVENRHLDNGGAIGIQGTSTTNVPATRVTLCNCSFNNNQANSAAAVSGGGAISTISSGNVYLDLRNSIFWNNISAFGKGHEIRNPAATCYVSYTSPNIVGPEPNSVILATTEYNVSQKINADPLFVDSLLHVSSSSPTVNSGYNSGLKGLGFEIVNDLDNYQRIYGPSVDLGAYENHSVPQTQCLAYCSCESTEITYTTPISYHIQGPLVLS